MATMNVKDAAGSTVAVEKPNANGRGAAAASRPVALSTEDKAALDAVASETTLAAVLAKIIAAPATETTLAAILAKLIASPATAANQSTLIGHVDGIETLLGTLGTQTTLAAILAKIISAPATEAKQDTNTAAVNTVGTRAYGTPLTRVASGSSSAQSAAITGTEVLVHASERCFILAGSNPTATTNSIPLEAGEKFHLRITSGHKIAVIRDTVDGFINIVPVA